ncbi:SLC13 family permease [candidate division CSSED10-310 bacterium]|uniref:SLC13 family permease n=1 Tax=candidate division CSSED10-310 bacterium TaxID=2855610 RepID=A0ABV6YZA0_UNCC1
MPEPLNIDTKGNITIKINLWSFLKVCLILAIAFASSYVPLNGLTPSSKFCLMLFVAAAGFWISEVIPAFATAIMVIVLSIYIFGWPGGMLHFDQTGYRIFLNPIASPVLVLFFGGFVLAAAATKHGLDVRLARAFIKPFGTHPQMVLLGIILTTGLFSMFMSNTATTAMMIAILTPLLRNFKGRDPFKKAMVLSVPFAANVGGIGTIIGTPPNAVAASVLTGIGQPISFLKWMLIGTPLAFTLLFILWIVLIKIFKPKEDHFEVLFPEPLMLTWDLVIVVLTFSVTILLWLTEPLNGIPAPVVALLPIMIFTMFGIIDQHDLKKLDWDALILVAGGLTLGVTMNSSGLSNVLVNQFSFFHLSPFLLLMIIVLFSTMVSNFMSNTSAANLIIPLVTSMAVINPKMGAIAVAFACSVAMSLPISTPPNAIAFATHAIETKDMAKYGTLFSLISVICIYFVLFVLHLVWL